MGKIMFQGVSADASLGLGKDASMSFENVSFAEGLPAGALEYGLVTIEAGGESASYPVLRYEKVFPDGSLYRMHTAGPSLLVDLGKNPELKELFDRMQPDRIIMSNGGSGG